MRPQMTPALDTYVDWIPLRLTLGYPGNSQAEGMSIFEPRCSGALALKHQFSLRYKRLKEYEKQCKREDIAR